MDMVQASDHEITLYLRNIGKLPNYDWSYPKDDQYRLFILNNFDTKEKILAFADLLDSQSERHHCIKAREIRSMLESKGFWGTNTGMKYALAYARRICCGCHDTGSFHPH